MLEVIVGQLINLGVAAPVFLILWVKLTALEKRVEDINTRLTAIYKHLLGS